MRPHLLFDSSELPALRRRLATGRGRKMLDHAVRRCGQYLDPADKFYFDFRERRSPYWNCREGNFMVPARMVALAFVGWMADRPEFLEAARDAMLTVIGEALGDRPFTMNPAFPNGYPGWRRNHYHDAGKYFLAQALLYDMLDHLLTPAQRELVLRHANESLVIGNDNILRARDGMDNNRSGRFFAGLAALAAAVEGEPGIDAKLAAELAENGPRWLERTVRLAYGRDGAPYEGAMYGGQLIYLLAAMVFARTGRRDLTHDARFVRYADYLTHEIVLPDGFFNNFNDCDKGVCAPELLYAACRRGRPAALWTWDQALGRDGHPYCATGETFDFDNFGNVPWGLLWVDDATPARSPEECGYPRAKHFRERGMVSMRTGWRPDDLHGTLFAGRQAHSCHCQSDQTQVTLYALGEKLLIDPGYSVTDPATDAKISAHPPEAHNLLFADGRGPYSRRDFPGWAEGQIIAFENGADFAYAVADARECYALPVSVRRRERHVFVSRRPDAAPYVLLVDDMELEDDAEHEFELLLLTDPANRLELSGATPRMIAPNAVLDIHVAQPCAPRLRADAFGPHPRLRLATRARRGLFALLLHPRRPADARGQFAAQIAGDGLETTVRLGDAVHRYRFDIAPRPTFYAGDERIQVRRLA